MKIALMMVTYNRLELTKRTIIDLEKKTKINYELIIVDNGSTDGTVDYLKTLKCSKLILNEENLGIGRGRNQALWEADKLGVDYYCTLDNDVELPENWLNESISILKDNTSYGAIGVNFEPQTYPLIKLNGYEFQNKPQGNLGTACMVFGKPLHKSIGFFKEYNRYGLEDSDFGMRARAFGYKLGYIKTNGLHLGVGDYDTGEYRKFKTNEHDSRVLEFQKNCSLYFQRKLPIYVSYKGD